MSSAFKTLIGSTAVIGLVTIASFQQNNISSYEQIVGIQDQTIFEQKITIEDQATEIAGLMETNAYLEIEIDLIRDSLSIALNDVELISQKLEKSQNSLNAVKEELTVRQKELSFLKSKIKKGSRSKTKEYRQEIAMLEQQVEQLTDMLNKTNQTVQEDKVEYDRKSEVAYKMTALKAIMDQSHIEYRGIELKESRDGDNISKLRKNGSNWKYTIVNLDIQNALPDLLLDGTFELRIVDMDTGEAVSYLESNMVYPNIDDSKGIQFSYPGHAQQVVFINTQQKKGSSYELKMYYLEDGQSYYVNNSSRPIIFDKQVID